MKRSLIVAVLVLAFLLMAAMKSEEPMPLGVRVSIAPSTHDPYQLLRRETPETYKCRAVVYTVADETKGIAAPEVVVAAGERQSRTVTDRGLRVTFTAAISKGNDRAATEVEIKRGEKIVFQQNSDVVLRAPGRAIVPLQ